MKGKEEGADRRRYGKTISKSGQERTLPAQLGLQKHDKVGTHLWCPDDLPMLWDRIEKNRHKLILLYHII